MKPKKKKKKKKQLGFFFLKKPGFFQPCNQASDFVPIVHKFCINSS